MRGSQGRGQELGFLLFPSSGGIFGVGLVYAEVPARQHVPASRLSEGPVSMGCGLGQRLIKTDWHKTREMKALMAHAAKGKGKGSEHVILASFFFSFAKLQCIWLCCGQGLLPMDEEAGLAFSRH